ncbi:MAG: NlpC/P60 family protein [Paracoccaceae bacterium]
MPQTCLNDMDARICAAARGWIGTPYHHAQSARGLGCDCVGLLVGVYEEVTGRPAPPLPSYGPSWADGGAETLLRGLATRLYPATGIDAGTIITFRYRRYLPARHVAIATGPDRMIHAYDKRAVAEVEISHWWRQRIALVFTLNPAAS